MKLAVISHETCLKHEMINHHPESPERLQVINNYLHNNKINLFIDNIPANPINKELLFLVHDKNYVEYIYQQSPKTGLVGLDPDTYMNPYTLDAALHAAGSVVQGIDLLMDDKYKRIFCNIRPPGHHATKNKAMGFCFFNNVCIAAYYALKKYNLERIAIVDFDAHQGNGTINIVKNDDKIFYASSYQSPYYPFVRTPESSNCLGVELETYTTSDILKSKYKEILIKKLDEFKPELMIISAGFDAFYLDPLTNLLITVNDFYWITNELVKLAKNYSNGRVISVLEGGYQLPELGECVLAHIYGLLEKNIHQLTKKIKNRNYPFALSEWMQLEHYKILIRPISPDDKLLYKQFVSFITPEDIRFRYFGTIRTFTDKKLNKKINIDYSKQMAFAAISYSEAKEEIMLGVVHFYINYKIKQAEFAILIRSDMKQHGLGTLLMNKMIEYCKNIKLTSIKGEVLDENKAMLEFVTTLGFTKKYDSKSAIVEISLSI